MSELPVGWTKETLAKLGTWTGEGTPTTTNAAFWTDGTIPWVSPKDMKQRRITTAQDSITEAAVRASATSLIPENSVMLVTRSGILRHSLPVATNTQPVTLNQDMKALTPIEALLPDYLYFAFRRFERDILHSCCKGGTTVQSIEAPRLMAFEIPIPPLPEQRRIVAKVEELFSELDEGVANLKKARAQLAVYRQALLKHAFEGHLTADWRTENQAAGLWQQVRLESVVDFISGFTFKSKEYIEDGVPVVRISDISPSGVSLARCVKIEASDAHTRFELRRGDILIAMSGATTGKFGHLKTEQKCYLNQRVGCLRARNPKLLSQEFLFQLLEGLKRKVESDAYGGAQPNISSKQINAYLVTLPPSPEQEQIVRILDEQFTVMDQLLSDIDQNLQKAEALRQSILKKAFAAELVPQDPADEPAAALLACIRAEREAAATAKPGNPRKAKKP